MAGYQSPSQMCKLTSCFTIMITGQYEYGGVSSQPEFRLFLRFVVGQHNTNVTVQQNSTNMAVFTTSNTQTSSQTDKPSRCHHCNGGANDLRARHSWCGATSQGDNPCNQSSQGGVNIFYGTVGPVSLMTLFETSQLGAAASCNK